MSNIIDFPNKNNILPPSAVNGADENMQDALDAVFKAMTPFDLSADTSRLIWDKLARILVYAELTKRVLAIVSEVGFNPGDFEPDRDSFEDFLIMDPEDYPADEMDDPDNTFNGPFYDWRLEDRVVRASTTVGFEGDSVSSVAISILSIQRDDDHWMALVNGAWVDGPDADEFGIDPFDEDWYDD